MKTASFSFILLFIFLSLCSPGWLPALYVAQVAYKILVPQPPEGWIIVGITMRAPALHFYSNLFISSFSQFLLYVL
jgi:hypothetical protein